MFQQALRKIVTGMFVGTGFALAMVAFIVVMIRWGDRLFGSSAPPTTPVGLVIESFRAERTAADFYFVGTLRNTGSTAWSYVSLEAELYDASDRFIDRCSGYENATIGPGKTRNFKIECSRSHADYDHARLSIARANHASDEGSLD